MRFLRLLGTIQHLTIALRPSTFDH